MRDLRRQRCSVVGCRPSDWTTEPRRHQVPRGGALRTAWLERIGYPVTHNGNLYVCGRHFAPEDYTIYLRRVESINFKSMLRHKAVPTLHLPVLSLVHLWDSLHRCLYEVDCIPAKSAPMRHVLSHI
nr:uncharacterized protein LOC119169716 [Rhipicephalus microplus]